MMSLNENESKFARGNHVDFQYHIRMRQGVVLQTPVDHCHSTSSFYGVWESYPRQR